MGVNSNNHFKPNLRLRLSCGKVGVLTIYPVIIHILKLNGEISKGYSSAIQEGSYSSSNFTS